MAEAEHDTADDRGAGHTQAAQAVLQRTAAAELLGEREDREQRGAAEQHRARAPNSPPGEQTDQRVAMHRTVIDGRRGETLHGDEVSIRHQSRVHHIGGHHPVVGARPPLYSRRAGQVRRGVARRPEGQ
ncbi:hypothetical protein GCM10018962_42550 [Dactylosporangium matsuzakiense]|nr:hypothetical protein [Dactylosporangium matsuzakiense]